MRIKKKLTQHRRDFTAIFECENCGKETERDGYDDRYFHDKVIPSMICGNCLKSRISLGIVGEYTETKYEEGYQI